MGGWTRKNADKFDFNADGTVSISLSTFGTSGNGNTAQSGGGIYIDSMDDIVTIDSSTIAYNSATSTVRAVRRNAPGSSTSPFISTVRCRSPALRRRFRSFGKATVNLRY